MKIVITGSLGNISKPLAIELVAKGHQVTVISSKPEKQKDIEALGAAAAIGTVDDVEFLTSAFTGADAVYCMVPPNYHYDHGLDLMDHYRRLGDNYAQAIQQSGVKHAIHLSSIGAHLEKGSGLILGHHIVEEVLGRLSGIAITYMRPTAFYYNLNSFIIPIKKAGVMASNYGGGDLVPWVSPMDIAAAVAEEIASPPDGRKVRYVASEELTCNEIAGILGAAIGKPDLQWIVISDDEMRKNMAAAGMPPQTAAGLVELNAAMHSGVLCTDYFQNRPGELGKVKMKDFAKEFAAAFKQN